MCSQNARKLISEPKSQNNKMSMPMLIGTFMQVLLLTLAAHSLAKYNCYLHNKTILVMAYNIILHLP